MLSYKIKPRESLPELYPYLTGPYSWPIDILRDKGLIGVVKFVASLLVGGRIIVVRVLTEIEILSPNTLTFSLAKAAPRSSAPGAVYLSN